MSAQNNQTSHGSISCGRDYHIATDLGSCLEESLKLGFDFICVPLIHPRLKREFVSGCASRRAGPLTRSDFILNSSDWTSLIVARLSPWLQLDSHNEIVRRNSEKGVKQELMFASHLGVPAVIVELNGPKCFNLSRMITENSQQNHQVPLTSASSQIRDVFDCGDNMEHETVTKDSSDDTWHWWNTLRSMCDTHKKTGLVLKLTANLPSDLEIDRWCGEPVKAVVIPTEVFLTNKKGFPVLSKAHQLVVRRFFKLNAQMILSGCVAVDHQQKLYYQYLEHLWQTQDPIDTVSSYAKGYEDVLQNPLQPLMDNLESQTYEVFEKDPVKYSQYQKAIYYALINRVTNENKSSQTVIVMVLGAGRGPLVTAALKAAQMAERKVLVYAVEKNPNAVITLQNLKLDTWGDSVAVIPGDMRVCDVPEKADIIVSELLGSFGDNELSPECLDGAQRFLKDDSISIPCSYTSYLAPLSSSKLWNEARACRDSTKERDACFETPYVVRVHNSYVMNEAKSLFTFIHPNHEVDVTGVPDNNRYGSVEFDIQQDTVLHGFAGYFHCVLYGDTTISIVPHMHTPGMFSWFPLYIPIKDPITLREGDKLVTHFWRINNSKNVWYEWAVSSPVVHNIHNSKGRSYTIGL